MAQSSFDGITNSSAAPDDDVAYREGYTRTMREIAWGRAHGWRLTERQIVVARARVLKVYETARGGKSIGGQRPEWLHGRADALGRLLRETRESFTQES